MSENLGLGVMIRMLSGHGQRSQEAARKALGKKIATTKVEDDVVTVTFVDGGALRLSDDGQSCCERRYLMTDDDPAELAGTTLVDIEVRDAPDEEDEHGECHEIRFLAIKTDQGTLTVACHNEHNGYYGGFSIAAEYRDGDAA